MSRFPFLLPILLLVSCSAYAAPHSAPAAHTASRDLSTLVTQSVPGRNLYQLTEEFKLHPPHPISPVVRTTSPNYPVGHQDTFWVLAENNLHYFRMRATIITETPHLYIYAQNGLKVDMKAVRSSARHFERVTYPTDHRFFGTEWSPGVDGDVHLTCLLGNLQGDGIAGAFSAEDEYPPAVNPYSNAREMFYINTNTLPGRGDFNMTMAHEFQHMIHFHMHPRDNAWLNEGMSMLAQHVNGYSDSEANDFLQNPGTQLNTWAESNNAAHYGGSYLFLLYLYDHYGSGLIHEMVADRQYTDIALVNDALRRRHIAPTAGTGSSGDRLFADWTIANAVNDPSLAQGQYGYGTGSSGHDLPGKVIPQDVESLPFSTHGSTPPYAAQYFSFNRLGGRAPFHLRFSAPSTVRLIGLTSSQPFWWSNRGDLIDTRLQRTLDLRHVHRAHLHYEAWWEIENTYDYGFVEASTDGGRTWTTLRATHTTRANPTGANLGNGYTGASKVWKNETVNLSRYAGRKIQLRFEYVTDDAVNFQGLAVRGITVPEIGFHDTQTGWQTHGFVPVVHNSLPSKWQVWAVEYSSTGNRVVRMPISAASQGSLAIDPAKSGVTRIVIVLFTTAPKTTVSSSFTLTAAAP